MNTISIFRNRLQRINAEALLLPIPDLSKEMAQVTHRLRSEYGDIARGAGDEQGIAASVIDYLQNHDLPTYRDIKYVCFGISSPYGTPLTRVIEHKTLFPKLLKEVEYLHVEPRKFRRCYQGLLKGYFRYLGQQTEHAVGHANWLDLREFLARHCKALKQHKPVLEWTHALYEHRNLLADEPCKPYGKALLAGDLSVVDELKNRLGIDDDTWVMNELVLAQVQAATVLADTEFRLQVEPLVQLLDNHPLLISNGLALLLKRYEACQEHTEHNALRDAVLREWRSPWLEAHKAMWYAQVGEAATTMVKLWLNKQYIKDFFGLLQADGQADSERMEFWLQYAEAIDGFWLALGASSFNNRQVDYQRIRQQMENRCMRLQGSNQNYDNAFLMKIGDYVFIEFGKQNNACHIFRVDNLPFKPEQTTVSGTTMGLKNTDHPGHVRKLTHSHDWQADFSHFLLHYAHAEPDKNAVAQGSPRQARMSQYETLTSSLLVSKKPDQSVIEQLLGLCRARNMTIVDHRNQGGALWVRAYDKHVMAAALKSAGFSYKEGKGWWLE